MSLIRISFNLKITDGNIWVGGITVQLHMIWSVHILPIIHNFPNLVSTEEKPCQLFSWLQLIFTSTNSYYIKHINFTIIEIFIPFYMSISIVSHYLLSSQLHLTLKSEIFWSTYLQQLLVAIWITYNIISFIFNKFLFVKYFICWSDLLLYHCF